jgi:hypothetical protein
MIFSKNEKDPTRWRTRFAFLPTNVGEGEDGNPILVWLERFEIRLTPSGSMNFGDALERRPRGKIEGLVKHYGEDGAVIGPFIGLIPWL